MLRVEVQPSVLRWAYARAGKTFEEVMARFPALPKWEGGELAPTINQLETFAKFVHVPIGYMFLQEPPEEKMPIPDLRTKSNKDLPRASADLIDVIHICQRRQDWYRDYVLRNGEDRVSFVGSETTSSKIETVAGKMRHILQLDLEERRAIRSFDEALRHFIDRAETVGVLVMVTGIVGSSTKRTLNPEEFRGFALSDDFAPLVFINGRDSKSAQMFTLAHELAHIWLGESALSDVSVATSKKDADKNKVENWCNQVAAELLVPREALMQDLAYGGIEIQRLTRQYKVSSLVILRRLRDLGKITEAELWRAYEEELEKFEEIRQSKKDEKGGGDYYRTLSKAVGNRFASTLIHSTLEGTTLQRDAMGLLGVAKAEAFNTLAKNYGYNYGVPS